MAHRAPILARRPSARLTALAVAALAILLAGTDPAGSQPASPAGGPTQPARRVLRLYGERRLTPAIVAVDAVIRSTIESRSPGPVTFYTEYLDLNLFDGAAPQPELLELLRRKYATRPLDVV